jgi:predicted permease
MSIVSEIRERLRSLFSRGRRDRELDEELAFHLEMATQENLRRGLTPEEARRQAYLRLGGVAQVREATRDARGIRWFDDFVADIRYALRGFVRAPGFALAAVLTLGLGIGATTAIYSVVHPLLLDPLPFEGGDRLARLWYAEPKSGMSITPLAPVTEAWQRDARSIEAVENYAYAEFRHGGPDGIELVSGLHVSHTFFDMLGVRPLLGRSFGGDELREDADVVLLGYGYWKRAFGGRGDVVGESLELDGRMRTIIGVVPAKLAAFEARDIWAPLYPVPGCESMGCGMLLARLRPGVPDSVAERELSTIAARAVEEAGLGEEWGAWVARLMRPQDELRSGLRDALRVLALAVGLVLLVAAANVAHLLLARAVVREREMAVRGALGAGRARLVRQLLTEGALLGAGGGVAGLVIAHWALRLILGLRPAGLEDLDRAGLSPSVLLFCLAISVLTVLLFGLAPAVRAGRTDPGTALRGGPSATADRTGVRLRRVLVAAEVALTVVLLVGAGLLTRGLIRLQATDPGFRSEGLYAVQVVLPEATYASAPSRAALRAELLERLRGMPGIDAATIVSSAPPRYGVMRGAPEAEGGQDMEEATLLSHTRVHADYFVTAGIPILEGRGFTEAEVGANAPVVVISDRTARRLWPQGGAVGSRLRLIEQWEWLTVVGVAGEIAAEGLLRTGPPRLQVHVPFAELSRLPQLGTLLVRATGSDDVVVAQIRAVFRSVAPDVAIRNIGSVDAQLARTLAGPRFNAALLASFAGLALLLAAIGLYGVLAYAVRRRTREFGIRKAVGAPRGEIVRSVVMEALVPVAIGTGLGLAGALAAGRVIESQLYGFPARDPLTLAAVVGVMLATALVAALVPARLATRVDPMVALRAE